MPPTTKQTFTAHAGALLAIDPRAYGQDFECGAGESLLSGDEQLTILSINGPLSYGSCWWLSYDQVRAAVQAACKRSAPVICMRVMSPGGDVYGAFDCARDLRKIAAAAGKRLVCHVEGQCASAGYALATAASEIVISATAHVGSVGVLCSYVDARGAAAQQGVAFTIISSGAYKTDGHDQIPIDDDMRARLQGSVDGAAAEFFALVRDHRGIDPEPLQAAQLMGQAAVDAGLADSVASWTDYHAALCSHDAPGAILTVTASATTAAAGDAMADKDLCRAELEKKASSKDPVEAARAKRALAAYDEVPDEKAEDDKPEEEASDDAPPPGDKDEDKEEKPEALAATAGALATSLRAAQAEIAALKARNAQSDMQALLDSRPDVPADTKKALVGLSLTQAKSVLDSIPRAGAPLVPGAAIPQGTQGAAAGESLAGFVALDPVMAAQFGFTKPAQQSRLDGNLFYLGEASPAGAK